MRYLKLFLIIMLLTCGVCYATTENDCKKYYDNKQYDKASTCYQKLLTNNKNNPSLKLGYANSLFQQKKYNAAKVQYSEIMQKYPNTSAGKAAAKNYGITSNLLKSIKTSRSQDSGNYISDITYVRWTYMPVKVWVEPGMYTASAKKAFMQWQSKTENLVSFTFVDKPEQAQITVYFKKDIAKAATGDALGITRVSFDNRKVIHFAQMDIKSVTLTGVKQTPNQIYAVVLHEVGHALGINGHSQSQYDVMYPSDDNYRNILSNRDINTVKYIYKK